MRIRKIFLSIFRKKNYYMKAMLSMIFVFTFIVCFSTCKTAINGCTDSSATNYNSKATEDDGSCIYGGQLVFWTGQTIAYTGDADSVFVNGKYIGSITNSYASQPTCNASGCVTYNAAVASYSWVNKYYRSYSLNHTSSGTAGILANNCTPVKVY
jgi:hypothetical protein